MTDTGAIIARIEGVRSLDDPATLDALDAAVRELGARPDRERAINSLLGVFERFPHDDGNGVTWGIVHLLETMSPAYEPQLVQSVLRAPGEFSLMMVNRLINGGRADVGGTALVGLLDAIATDATRSATLREMAAGFLSYQQSKTAG